MIVYLIGCLFLYQLLVNKRILYVTGFVCYFRSYFQNAPQSKNNEDG